MNHSIFVTLSTFAEHDPAPLEILRSSAIPFRVNQSGKRITTEELIAQGQDATVVVAGIEPYDAGTLARLPNLRCISRCGVGTDAIDLKAARELGIAVVNTPNVPTQAVAELTLAMMLALSRQLPKQMDLMKSRQWTRVRAHLLSGQRVGLIGLGRIGRRVVELLAPFGVVVAAYDPNADADWAKTHGVALMPLPQLLSSSDIISVHAAGSKEHPLRLGEAELALVKPGAIVVNVARGAMIDEDALCAALSSGRLAGAGLDVFFEEPYQGPLCDLDNVVLTPHSATLTVETRVAMETECVDKAIRFVQGTLNADERVV